MGISAHLRRGRAFFAVLGVVAAVPLVAAGQSQAASYQPPWDVFNNCPVNDPGMLNAFNEAACVAAPVSGGTITIGKLTTQLGPQLTSMGIHDTADAPGVAVTVPGEDGKTLVAEPAKIPGGLLNLVCGEPQEDPVKDLLRAVCRLVEENPLNVVKATAEPAGTPTFGLPTVTVPIKIKLSNPILGNKCYIGSDEDPIVLNLTLTLGPDSEFGLGTPIPGFESDVAMIAITNATYVDEAFSVPKASGCGPLNLLDSAVNSRAGLPSPSGSNAINLTGDSYVADVFNAGGMPGITLRDALASVAQ